MEARRADLWPIAQAAKPGGKARVGEAKQVALSLLSLLSFITKERGKVLPQPDGFGLHFLVHEA